QHEQLRRRRRRGSRGGDDRRERPADRAGRRRDAGGRPPRRGHGEGTGGSAEKERAGAAPVSAATRLLGVDYGRVRIGLAVSDPDRKIAFPLATHQRGSRDNDAAYFRKVIADESGGGLVPGLPVHKHGREGQAAAAG